MNKTTRRMKALLTAVALGVCCAYAQTATPGGFVLPNANPDADPYDFQMSKTDDGISASLILNRIDRIVTDSVAGTCRVSVPGLSSTTFAGLPALPYKAFRIAPEGSGTPQIIVRDSTYIDIPVNLDHNPRIDYDSIGQPHQIAVARVDYSGFMPSDLARVTDTQTYRDRPIYTITVMPMKYDRATGVLRVYTSLDIDIAYTVQAQTQSAAGVTRSAAFNAYTKSEVGRLSDFSEEVVIDPIISDTLDITEDYLVLSCSAYREATDSLKEWKKHLGHRVYVVEDWNWTTDKVDNVIKSQYNRRQNLTNVLILGNQNAIPGISMKKWCPHFYLSGVRDTPTDLPYMLFGNNSLPSVGYGRICATNAQQAMTAIRKIIDYEKRPSEDEALYKKAFLSGKCWYEKGKQVPDRFIPTLEDVRDILLRHNKDVQRIYTTDEGQDPVLWYPNYYNYPWISQDGDTLPDYLRKPTFAWDGTKQDIINAFNDGVNLGVYNGHGNIDGWPAFDFDYYACQHLTNNHNPLIFGIGCNTGEHTYINNLSAELSRRASGAIAVFASTSQTRLGASDALLIGFIDTIWPNAYVTTGWNGTEKNDKSYTQLKEILSRGLFRLEEVQGGGYWDVDFVEADACAEISRAGFHIFGDPSLYFNAHKPTRFESVDMNYLGGKLYVGLSENELPARVVFENPAIGSIKTYQATTSGVEYPLAEGKSVVVSISGPGKIPYIRQVSTSDLVLPAPLARITNVAYETGSQTAVVTYYNRDSQNAITIGIRDLYNNSYTVPTAFGPQDNQQTLYLSGLSNGVYVIALMVNNEIVDTYKLIKL